MDNPNEDNPRFDDIQKPSEDPSGFINSAYWAAETQNHKEDPLTKWPNQEYAYVSFTEGGSVSSVSFEDSNFVSRGNPPTNTGGGKRQEIKEFSRASRRRLLRFLASIDRTSFRAFKGKVISVTLTYPGEYPEDPMVCKRHLKALRKRLERMFGDFAGFWRLGFQSRGAPHFHLLLFMPSSPKLLVNLRHFVSEAWYEVCGKISEEHHHAGTRVEEIKNWRMATSYAERYVAKREEFPEGLHTGRVWGTWNERFLPVKWKTVKVSLRDAYRIRRVYRRLAGLRGRGPLHRLTVFVRHETVVRLLEFLGYRDE